MGAYAVSVLIWMGCSEVAYLDMYVLRLHTCMGMPKNRGFAWVCREDGDLDGYAVSLLVWMGRH